MVLRLDPGLAEWLAAVAEAEGRSVSEDNLDRRKRLLDLLRDDPP
jgi:hypothetical protein